MIPSGVEHRARSCRPLAFSLFALLLLGLGGGCRSTELLESELRARENDVRELRAEVTRLEGHNEALQREIDAGRQQGTVKIAPEFAAQTFTLRRLTLGRSTGGYDDDHLPGDEALQVVLEPHDTDDHVIKAPGSVFVTALEVTPEGLKTPISAWTVPPEQLGRSWRTGLFTTGYVLILPWQTPPTCEQVRVIARLQLADGRIFEADRDVKVRLIPDAARKALPPPGLTQPENVLPVPRLLQPGTPETGPALPAPTGNTVAPTANWQVPSLEGAVQLGRPTSLPPSP